MNHHSSAGAVGGSVRETGIVRAAWIAGFALFTAAGAQIAIPAVPVPFTLQTLFVLLSGAVLGARDGAAAQVAYLLAGAAGMPVFAEFHAGLAPLVGPTGGYLLAFPAAAFVTGYLVHDVRPAPRLPAMLRNVLAMTIAVLPVFAFGAIQLELVFVHDWHASVAAGIAAFTVWDAVKIVVAAGIAAQIRRRPVG